MSNIVMDLLSYVTSILTLWGIILGVVLGVVRIVSSYKNYPTELSYVLNQLELAKKTLHYWSGNVGISKRGLQHSQYERLVSHEILTLHDTTLLYVVDLPLEQVLSQMKSVKWNSILIRLKWAIIGKKKCLSQVQHIRDSVQGLPWLVPLRETAQPSMSMDRELFTSYLLFVDTDGTDFHLEVRDCIPVKSFVSALKKARPNRQISNDKEFREGLFCFVDENPHDASLVSSHQIDGKRAILADIWERNVWPGRRLTLIVFDSSKQVPETERHLMRNIFQVHVKSTC